MANINNYLSKILSAVYGEEVRGSIHDAISAINTESSNMNTQSSEALKKAQSLATDATNALNNFQVSLDAVEKANKSITEKVGQIMTGKIYDNLCDSSNGNILDSSGNPILGSMAVSDKKSVDDVDRRLKILESDYLAHVKEKYLADEETDKTVSDLVKMKHGLMTQRRIEDEILDSSGNQIFDSSNNNVFGSQVLSDQNSVDDVDRRLKILESDYLAHVKEKYLADEAMEETLSELVKMRQSLATGFGFEDEILDSDGNQIVDSSSDKVTGQILLADRGMVNTLANRVFALENILHVMMTYLLPQRVYQLEQHAVLDNTY